MRICRKRPGVTGVRDEDLSTGDTAGVLGDHVRIAGPLDGFGDFYRIPLSVGAMFNVNPKLTAGGTFSFLNIGGKGSSADFRALNIMIGYKL